jgi:hypothetical protein
MYKSEVPQGNKCAQGVASGDWKLLMINDDNDLIVANRYCAMCGVD